MEDLFVENSIEGSFMITKNDLTICSVAYNDLKTGVLDLMIKSVICFTDPTPTFVICDNGGNDLTKYSDYDNFTIVPHKNHGYCGSLQHGDALNRVFGLVNTKYTAIVESDCVVLSKDWCKIKRPHKVLAARKDKHLYHVCFLIFETEILRGIDFRPGNNKNRSNRTYKPQEDVGWQINQFVRDEDVDFVDFVDCKTYKAKIFKNLQSDEFHKNGVVISSHFGRGSNIAGKAIRNGFNHPSKQLDTWKNIVEEILNK